MASSSIQTRLSTQHSVFGQSATLPQCQLPVKEDVFRCYLWHRDNCGADEVQCRRELLKLTARDIITVWDKASIPTIEQKSVINKLERLISSANNLQKYNSEKRKSTTFKSERSSFDCLFDICSCKCVSRGQFNREVCKCKVKIPSIEWSFFLDQNRERKMVIGHVDLEVTATLQKRSLRKEREEKYKVKQLKTTAESSYACSTTEDTEMSDSGDTESECESLNENSSSSSDSSSARQNRNQYPNLCEVMERSGASNRDACRIINAYLADMGLNTANNLLEQTKLRRQRIMWRSKAVSSHTARLKKLKCIGFDGKIDDTRLYKSGMVQRVGKEDHYIIVAYPEEEYVEHVAPQSGKAHDIVAELQSVINDTESIDSLSAITCDSTNVNVGEHGGVIRLLELYLKRPLQWLICMLHLNELPFREVFRMLDGETAGPGALKGAIGKLLDFDPCNLPVTNYKPITGNTKDMPQNIKSDLSQDQKYLLKACLAVQLGHSNTDPETLKFLSTGSPGLLHHARWLTRANRLLRLYMGTDQPSPELVQLVSYIVNCYAPCWFEIKSHPMCVDGARNFFFAITCTRQLLDDSVRQWAESVLTRNCYFAHSESILLAALTDNDINIRRIAVEKIVAARNRMEHEEVRKFSKSSIVLNFDANDYFNMIDWNLSAVFPPPLVLSMSNEELMKSAEFGPVSIPALPCHTQAVERLVREVSRASGKVFGHSARHGMIISASESRKKHKTDTKNTFLAQ